MSGFQGCPKCGCAVCTCLVAAAQERDQLREEPTTTRRELEELRELVRDSKWMGVYMEPEGEVQLLGFTPDTYRRLMEMIDS